MNILKIFERAAREAGTVALAKQGSATIAVDKGEGDFATDADLAAGERIREILTAELPGVPILSEEQHEEEQARVLQGTTFLVVDDLDSTISFKNGCAEWGHNLGYVQGGVLTHAVMYLPGRDVLVTAARREGCFLNGKQVHLRQDTRLQSTMVGLTWARSIPQSFRLTVHEPLVNQAQGVRCVFSCIGGVTEVIEGKCSGFLNLVGHIWDFVGALAVEEAGGVALAPNGNPLRWNQIPMSLLAAANPTVAHEMLATTKNWSEYDQHTWR